VIKVYSNSFQFIAEIPVLSGSESREISGSYTLSTVVPAKTLKQLGIVFSPLQILEYGGVYYRQTTFSASDSDKGTVNISATDLLHADLINYAVPDYSYTTDLLGHLANVLSTTVVSISGDVPTSAETLIEVSGTNKLELFNKIISAYGVEYEINGANVVISHHIQKSPTVTLIKGKNVSVISENIDTANIVTKIYYRDKQIEDDYVHTLSSSNIASFPIAEEYKEFDGNAYNNAYNYLQSKMYPTASYEVSVAKNFTADFQLGTVCNIYCEQINISLSLRIRKIVRDITGETELKLSLGDKPPDFIEIVAKNISGTIDNTTEIEDVAEEARKLTKSGIAINKTTDSNGVYPILRFGGKTGENDIHYAYLIKEPDSFQIIQEAEGSTEGSGLKIMP
jgi:hypothetical protein